MERMIRKVAAKRLGISKELFRVLDDDNKLAESNKQRIQQQLETEIHRIERKGISVAEFQFLGNPVALDNMVRQERDPNVGPFDLARERYKGPEVAQTLHYMRNVRGQLIKQEQLSRELTLQQEEIKMARVDKQRELENSERVEIRSERAQNYRARLDGVEESYQAKTEQMQQRELQSLKQRQRYLEELSQSRSSALLQRRELDMSRLDRNQAVVEEKMQEKHEQVDKLKEQEGQVYENYLRRRQELFDYMHTRAAENDDKIKTHNIERENRYESRYEQRANSFKRRQEAYSQASQKFFGQQQEFAAERIEKQEQEWKAVYVNYEKLIEFDFDNKDQKWLKELEQHEEARRRVIMSQTEELTREKEYNDFKHNLAKVKRQQQKEQLEYDLEVRNLQLQHRFAKVDEFLSYKATVQNQNQQYGIADTYRIEQEFEAGTRSDTPPTKPYSRSGSRIPLKKADDKPQVITIDQHDVDQIVSDFEAREADIRKQLERASVAERVLLLRELSEERDRITEMQRQVNMEIISKIRKGQM